MKRGTMLALAAVMSVGISAPAMADYVRLGSVDVGFRTDRDTQWTRFGGPLEGLRLTADRSDIYCRSVVVDYRRGRSENVFSGRLREDRPVNVDLRGDRARVNKITFTCRSDERRGGKIYIMADVGRYRDDWRRDPDWSRLWAGIFGMDDRRGDRWDRRHDDWTSIGRVSFEGRRDSESAFTGWAGRSVDSIGLRPVDNDARCSRIRATFAGGRTRDLATGGRLERGRVNEIEIPGRDRNITRLDMTCRSLGDRRVTIEVLVNR